MKQVTSLGTALLVATSAVRLGEMQLSDPVPFLPIGVFTALTADAAVPDVGVDAGWVV